MIPKKIKPLDEGELRIGWASWDKNKYKVESIKWAYQDKRGHIARSSPEVPFDVLVGMVIFALEEDRLSKEDIAKIKKLL